MSDGVRLIHGDCLEAMAEVPDGSIDLILCDLPYQVTSCRWDVMIPFEPLWVHYKRILKPRGAVVLTASQPFTSMLVMSNREWFRHEWVWIKNAGSNFANTVREPMKEHESVLVFSPGRWTYSPQMQPRSEKGKARVKSPLRFETASENYNGFAGIGPKAMGEMRVPSSWQRFNRERGLHPTQKPLPLFEYMVRTYSNEGDTVLDSCMGSGTTGVACVNTGRHFVGIEKDENYFATAEKRIAAALADRRSSFQFTG